MHRFKKSIVALIGLVTLIVITTVLMPHTGYGSSATSTNAPSIQTQNVKVVNTASESVPIQGTATVNGTVQAQQNGTWNVGINGTPVVGLDAGNNTVKFDAVNNTVKIDSASPLPMRDVENPARQPFQADAPSTGEFPDGMFVTLPMITTIPAGKRLVIEQVSVSGAMIKGQRMVTAGLHISNSGNNVQHFLTVTPQGSGGCCRDVFIASQQVRLYADPGTIVSGFATRDVNTGFASAAVSFSISGYLVDVP